MVELVKGNKLFFGLLIFIIVGLIILEINFGWAFWIKIILAAPLGALMGSFVALVKGGTNKKRKLIFFIASLLFATVLVTLCVKYG